MPFHVRDPEVDLLVRDYARARGLGLTEAVRHAVTAAEASDRQRVEEKLRLMREASERIATAPRTGLVADKAFFDELSGDED